MMMNNVADLQKIKELILEFENPQKRIALSGRCPFLKPFIVHFRILSQRIKNKIFYKIAKRKGEFFERTIARHQSALRRKLGDSDPELQEKKIINLKRACQDLNSLIIYPDEVFSLWESIGKPEKKKGYTEGMLLSNGKIIEGMGGGLCQLSNFLCWIFLHAETEIVERYHHSMDVFPDSGRTLPFGSGATCLYNFVDLKIKNTGNTPIQIKLWLTERHLKGQLLSDRQREFKFSIHEENHCFIKRGNRFFRYNELYQNKKKKGAFIDKKLLFKNFAPVLYDIPENYFKNHGFQLYDFTEMKSKGSS